MQDKVREEGEGEKKKKEMAQQRTRDKYANIAAQ